VLCQCAEPIAQPSYEELAARLAEAERDAARYRTRRAEFSLAFNERPDMYDRETDALMRLRATDSASVSDTMSDGYGMTLMRFPGEIKELRGG
jgi:hypothetical protein